MNMAEQPNVILYLPSNSHIPFRCYPHHHCRPEDQRQSLRPSSIHHVHPAFVYSVVGFGFQ